MAVPLAATRPHPENFVWADDARLRHASIVEIVDFKMLKQSGLLVKVRYDLTGEFVTSWVHTKDFPVALNWKGHSQAVKKIYA